MDNFLDFPLSKPPAAPPIPPQCTAQSTSFYPQLTQDELDQIKRAKEAWLKQKQELDAKSNLLLGHHSTNVGTAGTTSTIQNSSESATNKKQPSIDFSSIEPSSNLVSLEASLRSSVSSTPVFRDIITHQIGSFTHPSHQPQNTYQLHPLETVQFTDDSIVIPSMSSNNPFISLSASPPLSHKQADSLLVPDEMLQLQSIFDNELAPSNEYLFDESEQAYLSTFLDGFLQDQAKEQAAFAVDKIFDIPPYTTTSAFKLQQSNFSSFANSEFTHIHPLLDDTSPSVSSSITSSSTNFTHSHYSSNLQTNNIETHSRYHGVSSFKPTGEVNTSNIEVDPSTSFFNTNHCSHLSSSISNNIINNDMIARQNSSSSMNKIREDIKKEIPGTVPLPVLAPRKKRHRSKELLTEQEKRANHIASEKKRRKNIRAGFRSISLLIPSLRSLVKLESESEDDEDNNSGELNANGSGNGKGKRRGESSIGPSKSIVLTRALEHLDFLIDRNKKLNERMFQLSTQLNIK